MQQRLHEDENPEAQALFLPTEQAGWIELNRPRQTLLRPSIANDADQDVLLRPAGKGEAAQADQLLRAMEVHPGDS